jgi:hypothetical protein
VIVPKRPFSRHQFVKAGLKLLEGNGYRELRIKKKRSAVFIGGLTPTHEPFMARFRSTMDRGLLATAESNDPDASTKIEGEGLTHVLLVTTSVLREKSPLEGYMIPMEVAVNALKENHRRWLATNPNHSSPLGSVTRWIALEPDRLSTAKYSERLTKHRLAGEVSDDDPLLSFESGDKLAKQDALEGPRPRYSGNGTLRKVSL